MVATIDDDALGEAEADVISLTVPAADRFVRLVRIGVASLARRRGFSVRAIDDLRLVVDESFILLLGATEDAVVDHDGAVEVTFEIDDHELSVTLVQRLDDGPVPVAAETIARFDEAISALVDRFDADTESGVVQFTKRR